MKKILVTLVEAGMGHIVTARAIFEALARFKNDDVQVELLDIFQSNETLQKYEKFLIAETKRASRDILHSRVQMASMYLLGAQNTLRLVHSSIYKKQVDLYVEQLRAIAPDVIIDTHYFTAYCAAQYRDRYAPDCRVVTYDPDNYVHGWWYRKVDYFIVNNEFAYARAIKKFSPKKVRQVYFISHRERDEVCESKQYYREKYGIPQDKFVVKIADGAYAKAKEESFVRELVKTDKPITIVAICGRNEKLKNKLDKLKETLPSNVTLIPMGFVDKIYEVFRACDLFITKAGPNAVLDSVLMRVPVVVNYWANKIEWATKELFVKNYGCGVVIENARKTRKFVESCIDNESILDEFVRNEEKIDKDRNGADEVAQFVLGEVLKSNRSKQREAD